MRFLLKRLAMHFIFGFVLAFVSMAAIKPFLAHDNGSMPGLINDPETFFYQLVFLSAITVLVAPIWIFADSIMPANNQALRLEMPREQVIRAMYYLHIEVEKLTRNQVIARIAHETKKT